jgi:hypothetical protein
MAKVRGIRRSSIWVTVRCMPSPKRSMNRCSLSATTSPIPMSSHADRLRPGVHPRPEGASATGCSAGGERPDARKSLKKTASGARRDRPELHVALEFMCAGDTIGGVESRPAFAIDPASDENGRDLQAGPTRYFDFYNRRRIHQSHEYPTPDEIHYATNVGEPLAIAA